MMRAVTRDSTKVSAMQAVHIMRNNLLSHLLEAEGTGVMPAMESKRGKTMLPLHSGAASTCDKIA